jgi:hypothetical protein
MRCPGPKGLDSPSEKARKNDCVIVFLVARTEDECDAPSRCKTSKPVDQLAMTGELAIVSTPEFLPLCRVVSEPLPQFSRRRELFHPLIDRRPFSAQASWPKSIDENAASIRLRWILISAFEIQRHDASTSL